MMKSVLIAVVSAVQAYLLGSIDTGILCLLYTSPSPRD